MIQLNQNSSLPKEFCMKRKYKSGRNGNRRQEHGTSIMVCFPTLICVSLSLKML